MVEGIDGMILAIGLILFLLSIVVFTSSIKNEAKNLQRVLEMYNEKELCEEVRYWEDRFDLERDINSRFRLMWIKLIEDHSLPYWLKVRIREIEKDHDGMD